MIVVTRSLHTLSDLFRDGGILRAEHAPALRAVVPMLSANLFARLISGLATVGLAVLVNTGRTDLDRHIGITSD